MTHHKAHRRTARARRAMQALPAPTSRPTTPLVIPAPHQP